MRGPRAAALLAALALAAGAEEASAPAPQRAAASSEAPLREGPVLVARVDGTINPASADYLVNAIHEAENVSASLLLIELDTPGGLVASTQQIVQAMLSADVPIAVYVTPKGAWAASAGTFITMAAHVAAMAPRASIGAAHPVSVFGPEQPPVEPGGERGPDASPPSAPRTPPADYGAQKAENTLASFIESIARERGRNVEWAEKAVRESVAVSAEEAVELNVVDLVANDRRALVEQIDGRTVRIESGPVRLAVKDAPERELPMGLLAQFLHTIWDPTIALMLLSAGGILLWIEFSSPGVSVPGILGAACIIVGVVSLQVLPFSWLGLLLFLSGIALFVAELFVTTHGILFAAGFLCMLLGGSMMFDRPDASDLSVPFWSVLVPIVGGFGAFGVLVAIAVGRVIRKPSAIGVGELMGLRGVASSALAPSGSVFVRGEYWTADADGPIAKGEPIEVVAVEGMRLRVRRATRRAS